MTAMFLRSRTPVMLAKTIPKPSKSVFENQTTESRVLVTLNFEVGSIRFSENRYPTFSLDSTQPYFAASSVKALIL